MFAPADSQKWKEFVKMLARDGEREWLDKIQELKPKEYGKMSALIEELMKEYTPEEQKRYLQDWAEAIKIMLPRLTKKAPDEAAPVWDELLKEESLANLSVEQLEKLAEVVAKVQKRKASKPRTRTSKQKSE
jgi:exonuclease V gamma subunit